MYLINSTWHRKKHWIKSPMTQTVVSGVLGLPGERTRDSPHPPGPAGRVNRHSQCKTEEETGGGFGMTPLCKTDEHFQRKFQKTLLPESTSFKKIFVVKSIWEAYYAQLGRVTTHMSIFSTPSIMKRVELCLIQCFSDQLDHGTLIFNQKIWLIFHWHVLGATAIDFKAVEMEEYS